MKLSCLSNVYSRFSLEKAFCEAQRLGLEGIEVWGGRPHAYVYDVDEKMAATIRGWAKQYGVEICSYCPENCVYPYNLCSQSEKERSETVQYFKDALDVAAAIGAPMIQITPGDPGYEGDPEEDWKHLCEGLREVCAHAEKVGVRVVMETLSTEESLILNTADDLVRLLRAVPSPMMFGMVDFVSPAIMYEPFSNYFKKLGPKMGHIHLADSDGKTADHLMIGEGIIPFKQVLSMIKEYDYPYYASIELSPMGTHGADPESYVELFVERLREVLSQI